jgi:hypothetical protein
MEKPFSDSEKGFNLLSIGEVTNKIFFVFMSDSREFQSRIKLISTNHPQIRLLTTKTSSSSPFLRRRCRRRMR